MTDRRPKNGETGLEPPALVREPGALQQWWSELQHGARTVHTTDVASTYPVHDYPLDDRGRLLFRQDLADAIRKGSSR